MRVLVVDDRETEREKLAEMLRSPSITVELANSSTAAQRIAQLAPHSVLLNAKAALQDGLLATLRAADRAGAMYALVILEEGGAEHAMKQALAAGAHDFIRAPFTPEELRLRADPSLRLRGWMLAVGRLESLDWSRPVEVSDLHAWRYLSDIVTTDLEQMLDRLLKVEEGWPERYEGEVLSATLPMSLPSAKLEVRVSVVADHSALAFLSRHLLQNENPSPEALNDMLGEVANTAGGALKRAALPEHATLTAGLPSAEMISREACDDARCWTVTLDERVVIGIVARIQRRRNIKVPAISVREGMVVVKDLRADSGTLLLSAGTRLTSTSAKRLRSLMSPNAMVEVVEVVWGDQSTPAPLEA